MVATIIEIKVEEFSAEIDVVKKLKMKMIMCQRKRVPVHAVRTGMNMKKELMRFLEIKK